MQSEINMSDMRRILLSSNPHGTQAKLDAKAQSEWHELDAFSSLSAMNRNPQLAARWDGGLRELLWVMWETPVLLLLLGVLSAVACFTISLAIRTIVMCRIALVAFHSNTWITFAVFFVFSVACAALANFVTQAICPEAVGGGIPEMKTVLSGTVKPVLLSWKLIWAKSLGLILANTAGFSVGKEGPFVHISCAIADLLMRLSCFKRVRQNDSKRLDILACACAAGVAATFGSAFGGVTFSIEVTATAYMVRNLPRAFLTTVVCCLVYFWFGIYDLYALFSDQHPAEIAYTSTDLAYIALLGCLCGLFGVLFNYLASLLSWYRNLWLSNTLPLEVVSRRRYFMVTIVAAIIAPLLYMELRTGINLDSHTLIDDMFQDKALGLSWQLILYVPYKFVLTILSVTLPLPVGLFLPVFLTGGVMGRLMGETLNYIETMTGQLTTFDPWEFAIIGAAAFSTGVTRAISTAVIVFELSGHPHLRIPLSFAILVAYFIGNRFTRNVYEVLMNTNGTPYLPDMPVEAYSIPAADVMTPVEQIHVLSFGSTYARARELLTLTASEVIPVVQSDTSYVIVGAVLREDLRVAVETLEGFYRLAFTSPVLLGTSDVSDGEMEPQDWNGTRGEHLQHKEPSLAEIGISPSRSHLGDPFNQKLHFIMFTEGGRKAVPVITASNHADIRWTDLSISVPIDTSPYQVVDTMQLAKVDLVFRMLKLNQAYVTRSGRLVGIITRTSLREFIGAREKRPIDRCLQLCSAFCACCRRLGYSRLPDET